MQSWQGNNTASVFMNISVEDMTARRVEAGLEVLEAGADKLAGTAGLLSLQDKQRVRTVHSALACLLQTGPS